MSDTPKEIAKILSVAVICGGAVLFLGARIIDYAMNDVRLNTEDRITRAEKDKRIEEKFAELFVVMKDIATVNQTMVKSQIRMEERLKTFEIIE